MELRIFLSVESKQDSTRDSFADCALFLKRRQEDKSINAHLSAIRAKIKSLPMTSKWLSSAWLYARSPSIRTSL